MAKKKRMRCYRNVDLMAAADEHNDDVRRFVYLKEFFSY